MSFPELEKLVPFENKAFEPDQPYDVKVLSDDDWYADDLFGEEPESVRFHQGNIVSANDLVLSDADEYGYYVVDGDLHVEGVLRLTYSDLYNVVVIMGNLSAKALIVGGECQLYVIGTTTLSGPILTTLSDGGACCFKGRTVAEAVLNMDRIEPSFSELDVTSQSAQFRSDYAECPAEHFEAICSDLSEGKSVLA